jgi:hypothetical protein
MWRMDIVTLAAGFDAQIMYLHHEGECLTEMGMGRCY